MHLTNKLSALLGPRYSKKTSVIFLVCTVSVKHKNINNIQAACMGMRMVTLVCWCCVCVLVCVCVCIYVCLCEFEFRQQ